ncbi:hypothetical protein R1sor_000957 [Riccia sorocarpa]|uniref:Uncharacterized protein n=1 Tax=Riccia sorocarpa TaxID=122646 RepID=A0ABD3GUK9_9MARC
MEVVKLCGSVSMNLTSKLQSSASALSVKQMNGEALQIAMRRTVKVHPAAGASARPGTCRCLDVDWDPEGLLGRPSGPGLINRNSILRKFKDEADKKAAVEAALKLEAEQRKAAREARVVPATDAGLVEYFVMMDPLDMEFEIARCRPRLTEDFRRYLRNEIGSIRLTLGEKTPEQQLRLEVLETLQRTLEEGVAAYDRLTANVTSAKDTLVKILTSKDKKATLLELAGENKLNKGLLALLDENIAAASAEGQDKMVEYMGKIRAAVVKYVTVESVTSA